MNNVKTFVKGNAGKIVKGAAIALGVGVAAVVTALGLRKSDVVQIDDVIDTVGEVVENVVTETVD